MEIELGVSPRMDCDLSDASKSLTNAVREFSLTSWVRARAHRLRIYRAIVNSIWLLLAAIVLINLARWNAPTSAWVLTLVTGVYLLCWFVLSCGFYYGFFRCPSCEARFAPRFPPLWAPRRCQNCTFDIYTLKRANSSSN